MKGNCDTEVIFFFVKYEELDKRPHTGFAGTQKTVLL